jgi:hypothetical protein
MYSIQSTSLAVCHKSMIKYPVEIVVERRYSLGFTRVLVQLLVHYENFSIKLLNWTHWSVLQRTTEYLNKVSNNFRDLLIVDSSFNYSKLSKLSSARDVCSISVHYSFRGLNIFCNIIGRLCNFKTNQQIWR